MEVSRHRSMPERMLGAALLNADVYEEVEADTDATSQAALVVVLVAAAAAIGGARGGAAGVLAGVVAAFLGWLLWSGITYIIGDKILGGTATWGELLRTIGFAQSPGLLYAVAFVPLLGWFVRLFVAIWILVAVVIAIRQALDFGTGRAVLTAVLGFFAYLFFGLLLGWIVGVGPQVV